MRIVLFLLLLSLFISPVIGEELTGSSRCISSVVTMRDEISDHLGLIDKSAASVSLLLCDVDGNDSAITPILAIPGEKSQAVVFTALVSSGGVIEAISPNSYNPLLNTSLPYPLPDCIVKEPFITPMVLYSMSPEWSQSVPSGRDFIWPVRTRDRIALLVIHLNESKIVSDAVKKVDISPDLFFIVMDEEGNVIETSDMNEVLTVPPDNILTEFPTFRDVKQLIVSLWSGYSSYDVWKSDGIVRSGAWSSFRFYNQVWKVMIAGKIT